MAPTTPLDLNWLNRPHAIASALLRSENSVALIDPGPSSCLDTLRQQLRAHGLRISDLEAILLTHIHLDHAGSTGTLVRENPRLKVYVHENGAPHMSDPTKLLNSAARLYGNSMQHLYGEFLPVPSQNLHILRGSEIVRVAGRQFQVLHTPGHASHHVTYFDKEEGTAFVGDNTGISVNGHSFILPATPPPDISLELWDKTLDAINDLRPQRLFLTHFAFSDHPAEHIAHYRKRLHHWSEYVARILASGLDDETSIQKFSEEVHKEADRYLKPGEFNEYSVTAGLDLSFLGLARYHRKRAQSATQ
jgi:glyoxylase-like metal-dependent hydrolase (beta-lactamase superfamily II)